MICTCGCDGRRARFAVLVPWLNTTTGEKGEGWTHYSRACLPTAEAWPVRRLLPVLA